MMKFLLPILILIGGGAIFALISKPKEIAQVEPEPLPPRKIEVLAAQVEDLQIEIEAQGFVRPRTQSNLSSEISGKIVATSPKFYPGEFVKKGEVLVEVEAADYEAAFRRAQAQVVEQALILAEEEARSEQALIDWERLNSSEASSLTLREPQLANARASLDAAKADLEQARRNLERTQIRAPFDALVKTREVATGQFISPGSAVGLLYAIDFAEIRVPILAHDLPLIALPDFGDAAAKPSKITLINPSTQLPGNYEVSLVRSENVIDENDRVLYAVARVVDPYGWVNAETESRLRIGTFVTARIQSIPMQQVVRLPRIALRGTSQVAVVSADDTIIIRDIEIRYLDGDYIYVGSGIQSGELISLTSPQTLYAGTRVEWVVGG
ncbi:MAG: efflux RND transporter periplasmic adaptor subunit [Verrucomicrobiota bacterium]